MRLQPGTIYFARETNLDGKGYTDLVKIGLVEDPRTDRDRLADHQTGNPRKLEFIEGHSVKTAAVKYVESQMHRAFASKRIQGEWFRFTSESEIQAAVEKAKALAFEVGSRVHIFAEAQDLEKVFNQGDIKPSTPDLIELRDRVLVNQEILNRYGSLTSKIRSAMVEAIAEEGKEVEKYMIEQITYHEPKFSTTKFKKLFGKTHKELIEQCTSKEEKPYQDFHLIEEGLGLSIPEDTETLIRNLDAEVDDAVTARDFYRLNNLLLQIREDSAFFEWEVDFDEAQIKVACGEAPGIEDVCVWIRELRLGRASFDKAKLASLAPDLYYQGFEEKKPTIKRVPKWYKTDEEDNNVS